MGNKDKRIARVWKEIDEILWTDWNPIGVNGASEARDEYQSYIGGVFRLLEEHRNEEELASHLHEIETESMGLSGNVGHCQRAALKLLTIDLSRHPDE